MVDFHFPSSLVLFLLSLRLKGEAEERVEPVGQVFGYIKKKKKSRSSHKCLGKVLIKLWLDLIVKLCTAHLDLLTKVGQVFGYLYCSIFSLSKIFPYK